jgi:hypothetical protein
VWICAFVDLVGLVARASCAAAAEAMRWSGLRLMWMVDDEKGAEGIKSRRMRAWARIAGWGVRCF